MKRSAINNALKKAIEMTEKCKYYLPKFASYNKEDFETKELSGIKKAMLGWDVTDFGSGEFENLGLTAFTIRNGVLGDTVYGKPYAEKLLFLEENQHIPMHFHAYKMEDIINRGGGDLRVVVYNKDESENLSDADVTVMIDGEFVTVKAGETLLIKTGQSVTIHQGLYHEFYVEGGYTMLGEVSMVNDDNGDNRFYKELKRFSEIIEDEEPLRVLCNEYD